MGLFTIEAEGRPVMVVAAEDWEEAREFADSEALRADLLVLEHGAARCGAANASWWCARRTRARRRVGGELRPGVRRRRR